MSLALSPRSVKEDHFMAYHDAPIDYGAPLEAAKSYLPFTSRAENQWSRILKKFGIPCVCLIIGLTMGMTGSKMSTPIVGMVGSTLATPMKYRPWTTSYSPALPHVSFKPERDQVPKTHETDPMFLYMQPVSYAQEEAWTELLHPMIISLTKDEMELANEDPSNRAQLIDRENYPAALGVYHELHCLRMIRRFVYQEHWYANSTPERVAHERAHADHCLHTIHKSVMCYGNIGLNSFKLKPHDYKPKTMSNSQRTCVDWEKFHGWASSVGLGQQPLLYRPDPFQEWT